jgi:acyl carrier protein
VAQEQELVLDPAFFEAVRQRVARVEHVSAELKRLRSGNELARFRYDVTLRVGDSARGRATVSRVIDWERNGFDVPALYRTLRDDSPDAVLVEGIPNARVATDVAALKLLGKGSDRQTAGDLRGRLTELPSAAPPEAFWSIADDLPYDVSVEWSPAHGGERYDVIAVRRAAGVSTDQVIAREGRLDAEMPPWEQYANDPLRGAFARQFAPALRRALQQQLPEYMVPSAFVVLDSLPVSPNGKVDRSALPVPDAERPSLEEAYVPPRTPIEEALSRIWVDLLGVERVGVHDNFFALGGHSLLATQLMSRVRKVLGVELPLRALFDSPTVAGLAERIETLQWAGQSSTIPEISRQGYEEGVL